MGIDDKIQIAIPKSITFGGMFSVVIGVMLGVTTGHLRTGIDGGVSMALAGAVGFRILEYRKLG